MSERGSVLRPPRATARHIASLAGRLVHGLGLRSPRAPALASSEALRYPRQLDASAPRALGFGHSEYSERQRPRADSEDSRPPCYLCLPVRFALTSALLQSKLETKLLRVDVFGWVVVVGVVLLETVLVTLLVVPLHL